MYLNAREEAKSLKFSAEMREMKKYLCKLGSIEKNFGTLTCKFKKVREQGVHIGNCSW